MPSSGTLLFYSGRGVKAVYIIVLTWYLCPLHSRAIYPAEYNPAGKRLTHVLVVLLYPVLAIHHAYPLFLCACRCVRCQTLPPAFQEVDVCSRGRLPSRERQQLSMLCTHARVQGIVGVSVGEGLGQD